MSGLRAQVNQMEVMGHRSLVELNADELCEPLAIPPSADGAGRRQTCLVVRMDGDFDGGGVRPLV